MNWGGIFNLVYSKSFLSLLPPEFQMKIHNSIIFKSPVGPVCGENPQPFSLNPGATGSVGLFFFPLSHNGSAADFGSACMGSIPVSGSE